MDTARKSERSLLERWNDLLVGKLFRYRQKFHADEGAIRKSSGVTEILVRNDSDDRA